MAARIRMRAGVLSARKMRLSFSSGVVSIVFIILNISYHIFEISNMVKHDLHILDPGVVIVEGDLLRITVLIGQQL
jgi:hypothetical protein